MAKLPDFSFRGINPQVSDFKDAVRDLVNYGKFQFPVVAGTPAWTTNNGEAAVSSTLTVNFYVRAGDQWWNIGGGGGSGSPGGVDTNVQYNASGTFGGDSGLSYYYSAGTLQQLGASPEHRIVTASDNRYTRIVRAAASDNAVRYNAVYVPDGSRYSILLGNSNQIVSGQSNALPTGSSPFSTSMWVKPTTFTGDYKTLLFLGDDISGLGFMPTITNDGSGKVFIDIIGQHVLAGTLGLNLNSWNHIGTTYNGSTLSLYINGILDATTTTTLNIANTASFAVASFPDPSFPQCLSGYVDEIRVYAPTVMNGSQMTALSNGGNPAGTLALRWALETGSGGHAYDSSGNNIEGQIGSQFSEVQGATAFSWSTDIAAPLVSLPGSYQEAEVWKSIDGTYPGAYGTNKFGDSQGKTVIRGDSIVVSVGSNEVSTLTVDYEGLNSPDDPYNYVQWVGNKHAPTKNSIRSFLSAQTFFPVRSNEVNLDSNVTLTKAQYIQVGSVVTVSGRFTANPTSSSTLTSFEMTLPISSRIGVAQDATGTAFSGAVAGMGAEITGVPANATAQVQWVSSNTASQTWSYVYLYQVS